MADLTTAEAAERLGISHGRFRKVLESGALPFTRKSATHLIDPEALDRYAHTRAMDRGRPYSSQRAWTTLRHAHPLDSADPDRARRRLRPRAQFERFRYNPDRYHDIINDPRLVISSRPAALHAGVDAFDAVPDDHRSPTVVYLRQTDLDDVRRTHALRATDSQATLVLAIIDDPWPFTPGQRYVGLDVAWIDLEDERDRAANLVAQYWARHR